MEQPEHILNEMGIMPSFSVAKKITESEVRKFYAKHEKAGKTGKEIAELLRKKIVNDIQTAMQNDQIPGIIAPTPNAKIAELDRTEELNKLASLIICRMLNKKYHKMSLCYFINCLVGLLGLTEEDFDEFHSKYGSDEDDDSEENE